MLGVHSLLAILTLRIPCTDCSLIPPAGSREKAVFHSDKPTTDDPWKRAPKKSPWHVIARHRSRKTSPKRHVQTITHAFIFATRHPDRFEQTCSIIEITFTIVYLNLQLIISNIRQIYKAITKQIL